MSTTLVIGKVLVGNGQVSSNLTPGHQAMLDRNTGEISISEVDVYNEISWKDGLFSFKNKSLGDIMAVLSRWYDVEVSFNDESLKELTFNGAFRKTQQIEEILDIIENTNMVNYEINQKTITMK